jgi:ABC-type sugar transport system ATPase subunit
VLDGVSLRVRTGEVVALAGAMGSGRTALLSALFGIGRGRVTGRITLGGAPIELSSPRAALARGIALVPEDRKASGLVLEGSVSHNLTLSSLACRMVDEPNEDWRASKQVSGLRIKTAGLDTPVGHLSGGNQQKVVLGRCLMTDPRLLLLDEPTRGVDIGARAEIYRLIRDLVAGGRAVLMASSDLAEILSVSDRVIVMREGRVAGELPREGASEEAIMQLAVGTAGTVH